MAKKLVFLPSDESTEFVKSKEINFTWHPGFSISQKKKSIVSLHKEIKSKLNINNILEISSKSDIEVGRLASAFNLSLLWNNCESTIESFYQGSCLFRRWSLYRFI